MDKYYEFFGDYDTKGCYYYEYKLDDNGPWKKSAFYGIGGKAEEMDKHPAKPKGKPQALRPENNICNCKHNYIT